MKRKIDKFIRLVSVIFGIKPQMSLLEKTDPEDLVKRSKFLVIGAFMNAAKNMSYYRSILKNANIDWRSIKTIADFTERVPLARKTDIFPVFKAEELCRNKDASIMMSAIVSSGTSGIFSYGLLSSNDIANQKGMIDGFINYYFDLKGVRPTIVNALPMGVSFASSYPVIPTSIRTDIVLQVIRTFIPYTKKCLVITDPHVAKKIIEDGIKQMVDWKKIPISFLVGGAGYSNSFLQYILYCISEEKDRYVIGKNSIDGTMGITEVGLNIFTESADLIRLRNIISQDNNLIAKLFGDTQKVCPSLMYYYPTQIYLEIINPDKDGFGEIVLSHLNKKFTTPLMRYATGDQGKILDLKELPQFKPRFGLPIIAVTGRVGDFVECNGFRVSPNIVKEALYRDHKVASRITGHFTIQLDHDHVVLMVQAKKDEISIDDIASVIQSQITAIVPGLSIKINCVAYLDFHHDLDLNYEMKWKHIVKK